jgi:Uma2 family endonuclease
VSLPAPRHHYSFAQYLEVEEISEVRHEYYEGEIYAMAGRTPEHAAIAAAVMAALGRQLDRKPCRVYSSDLRVRILATGLATYPDVTVICGAAERDPYSPTHVVNPKVVVEVLSPSTEAYDRTEKLQHYQQVPSLDAIVLVESRGDQVTLWRRKDGLFEAQTFGRGELVRIDVTGCSLAVEELFAAAQGA